MEKGSTGGKRVLRIGFWNVTRAKGKDEQFWEKIMKWDVMLVETWIE